MIAPLYSLLPSSDASDNDQVLDRFLEFVAASGLELYPAQEEAILELYAGKNVILNTPTGSGKSLVAQALHFHALANNRRSYYTCPIKALVNEKFLNLCQEFGADQVGMITGDATVNRDAPIICCTAEILSNIALREGASANVGDVVMDEFHYYSDKQRGVAWQIPLLSLPHARFLLMSATLGDVSFFKDELEKLTQKETSVVSSAERPVPLTFEYRETPLHETIADIVEQGLAPIYIVNFTQKNVAETAQSLLSSNFCTKEEKQAIAAQLESVKFASPYGKDIQRFLRHGVGIHHAGLLPKYRVLVEKLAQKGFLKLICGTDTLGVGVNVPIRTVLFTRLCKYDGEKTAVLSVRDFLQIAGRAGRKGFDTQGRVVVQAPEHVIENKKMELKAAGDPKKLRKMVRKQPPPKGFVAWDQGTFKRLVEGQPEPLVSRFQVNHGMLLNVLSREEDGCQAMRELIRASHDPQSAKASLRKNAFQIFRSLLDRKIIEFMPPEPSGRKVQVNIDLQQDFSLHQDLSLYLLDTLKLLDPEDPEYALRVLTLVESTLENPDLILRKQLDRVKTEKLAEMKQAGMDYDERMEELDKLEHPKPMRDFIYGTYNDFASKYPWLSTENIKPKSIAREMYETFQSFDEYIRDYDLQKAEGLLLRYTSDVYKTLVQTVPDTSKNDEILELEVYFGQMIRRIDSSLIEEWERMRGGDLIPTTSSATTVIEQPAATEDITKNRRAFTVLIRNQVFSFLRALALRKYDEALEFIERDKPDGEGEWVPSELEELLGPYHQAYGTILMDQAARGTRNTTIAEDESEPLLRVEQKLIDPEGESDWVLRMDVDLVQSFEEARLVMRFAGAGPIGF